MSSTSRLFTHRFAALWIFQFGTFFSVFRLLPVMPLHILDLGGSKAATGSFLAVYTFNSAFAAPANSPSAAKIDDLGVQIAEAWGAAQRWPS